MTDFTAPARLVVIGVDAARPDLLDAWISDGTLPHLRALVERGVSGRTHGMECFFVGSTWPSMYTGTNPANHGIHYLTQLVTGSYELYQPADEQYVRRPAFWKALSDAGQRVAVLDVPLSKLDTSLHGMQVVEWGGHDSIYGFRTHPMSLADEMLARHGAHPVGATCDADRQSAADYRDFVTRLEAGVERKEALTLDALARGGWDLFMQVFTEAHCAGHQCWHLHDRAHPAHDASIAAEIGDPLRRVYTRIDAAIGKVIAAAGDVPIVVFSAHGMSHWYGAQFLLPDILQKLGACVAPPPTPPTLRTVARAMLLRTWKALPERIRVPVRMLRRAVLSNAPPPPAKPIIHADFSRSRCFPHPNGLAVGGIRLNIADREPQGILKPGKDVDEFIDWLTAALLDIIDERTGKPLIARVVRTAALYSGEHLDVLPDLLVEWSDAIPTGSVSIANGAAARVRARSPLIGVVEGENSYARTGEHRPGGWLVAAGPGIAPGKLNHEPSLMDIAPTLTAMLGVELPECDGRPIEQLVRPMSSPTPQSALNR